VLAELAAANAAYAVIKTALSNGKELLDCAESLGDFFDSKTKLQQKVNNTPPERRSDLQEFLALEQIKKREEELREAMIYSGRAGMWEDWLQFQAAQKKRRKEAEKRAVALKLQRQKKVKDAILIAVLSISLLSGIGIIGWLLWWIKQHS
jgi:DNA repair protein RadC